MPGKRIFLLGDKTESGWSNYYIVVDKEGNEEAVKAPALDFFAGSVNYIEVTYADLQTAIGASALSAGTFYAITDYQTIYDQPDYDISGNAKVSVATKTGAVTTLIVLATSDSTVSHQAFQPAYPKDRILYDVTFTQTEYTGAPAKGRIIERVDEFNNRTGYDHREVLFKRYETVNGSGIYDSFKDTGFASAEFLTFNNATTYDNFIKTATEYDTFLLPNNVFLGKTNHNSFGGRLYNNTFLGSCNSNQSTDTFSNNILGSFTSNKVGNAFSDNVAGDDFNGNVIANNFSSNQIANNFIFNNIASDFTENTVGADFSVNTINSGFAANIVGPDFTRNVVNSDVVSIDFSSATHVYQPYVCEIVRRQDGALRLKYLDNTDALVVANVTA